MINTVILTDRVQRQLLKVPRHIAEKLLEWRDAMEASGLEVVRLVRGYHDEPLHGRREGQRSLRLSLSYRAVYVVVAMDRVTLARVEEVTKHGY